MTTKAGNEHRVLSQVCRGVSAGTSLAMSLATPRILPAHLHAFSPDSRPAISTVRMLGKITAIHGDQATLASHENQTVTLIMNRYESVHSIIGCCAKSLSETLTLLYTLIMRSSGRSSI